MIQFLACLIRKLSYRRLILAAFVAPLLVLPLGSSFAALISAEAIGTYPSPVLPFPNTLTNGDFTISPIPTCPMALSCTTGDGINEITEWAFDFSGAANLSEVRDRNPISAILTLTLTPRDHAVSTDSVRIVGLPPIETPIIQSLPVGTFATTTVTIELLDFYKPSDVLQVLTAADSIPMRYIDDAVISYARLDIEAIPSPTAFPVIGGALILLLVTARSNVRRCAVAK